MDTWQFIVFLCFSNAVTLYLYWFSNRIPFIHPIIRAKMTRIAKVFKIKDTPDEVFAQTVVLTDVLCNYVERGCKILARDSSGNELPVPLSPDWSVHE